MGLDGDDDMDGAAEPTPQSADAASVRPAPVDAPDPAANGAVATGDGEDTARHGHRRDRRTKHAGRSLLPLGGGGRILRFSRRRSVSPEHGSHQPEDDLYLAIGRVAANWSLLEVVSGLVLMGLVGSRDETVARAVVAGQRVENVWETIDALLATYGDGMSEQLAEFRSWRRAANTCRRRRNEAIHSAWSLTASSGKPAAWDMMSQKAKQGARADLFPGGVVELGELAQDIAGLEARLAELHGTIFFPPEAELRP